MIRRRFLQMASATLPALNANTLVQTRSPEPKRQSCYTEEWRRTRPNLIVYLPPRPLENDGYNDHFLVEVTPKHHLLAIWTQGTFEGARDLRVVYSRSEDGGKNWCQPQVLAGVEEGRGMVSTFGFPIVNRQGRIYCFYNRHRMVTDGGSYSTGVMRYKYSDDDGNNWQDGGIDILQRRTRFDHPDPRVGCKTIVWQKPIRDGQGRVIVGFSRWSSLQIYPRPVGGNRNHLDSQCELMRFDNIDESPGPNRFTSHGYQRKREPFESVLQ